MMWKVRVGMIWWLDVLFSSYPPFILRLRAQRQFLQSPVEQFGDVELVF